MRHPIEATGRQWKTGLLLGVLMMVAAGPISSAVGFFGVFFTVFFGAGAAITIVAAVGGWLTSG